MMNILFISGIYPPDIGGPATYVSRMALEFTRLGHKIGVLTLGEKNERIHRPFKIRKVPRGKNVLLRVLRMLGVAFIMARQSEIIYATGSPWDSWIVSIFTAKIMRKKLVIKIVGDPIWEWAQRRNKTSLLLDRFNEVKGKKSIELLKFFRNYSIRFVDSIIVPSFYLRKVVEKWPIEPHKVHVIYNAVEEVDPKNVKLQDRDREVATVGRFTPWKGIDGIIRIAGLLPADVKSVIIGDGPLKAVFMDQVKIARLQDKVIFTGTLPKHELLKRLTRTSIVVLNSRYEGLPHTLLEAMAAGAAVVATDVGGNSEVVINGENGFLVPLGDERAMAEKINYLLENDDMRIRIAEKGRDRIQRFTWANLVSYTEQYFESIHERKKN